MGFEESADQMTVAPANVANGADTREVVVPKRLQKQVALERGMACHCSIKVSPIARVRPRIFESRRAKLTNEAILLTIADDVRQMLPNGIVLRRLGAEHPVSQRLGMIGSKQLAQFTGRKTARVVLHKKAKRCESPHEPVKKCRINVKFCRDGLSLLRTIAREVVKDTKLHPRVKNLAAPPSVNQIEDFVSHRAHAFASKIAW
jgi:hypothetical protein